MFADALSRGFWELSDVPGSEIKWRKIRSSPSKSSNGVKLRDAPRSVQLIPAEFNSTPDGQDFSLRRVL
jgi:hypothetical protein